MKIRVEVIGSDKRWEGEVAFVPREGEHITIDDESMGHVTAVLHGFDDTGHRVTVRVR